MASNIPTSSRSKRTKKTTSGPRSSTPSLFVSPAAAARYALTVKGPFLYERRVDFKSFRGFQLQERFHHSGILPLIVNDNYADFELSRHFWANLDFKGSTIYDTTFTTRVLGKDITFKLSTVCEHLKVSMCGIDPNSNPNIYTIVDYIAELTGKPKRKSPAGQRPSGKLLRREVPLVHNVGAYLLHYALFPRGGNATDEIPYTQILTLRAMAHAEKVNVAEALFVNFCHFAKNSLKFLPYPRLVSYILSEHGFRICESSINREVIITLAYAKATFHYHSDEGTSTGTSGGGGDSDDDEDDDDEDVGEDDDEDPDFTAPPAPAPYTDDFMTNMSTQMSALGSDMSRMCSMMEASAVWNTTVNDRLDAMAGCMNGVYQRLDDMSGRIDGIYERFDDMGNRVSGLYQRFDDAFPSSSGSKRSHMGGDQ